jgi:hypothetical protein
LKSETSLVNPSSTILILVVIETVSFSPSCRCVGGPLLAFVLHGAGSLNSLPTQTHIPPEDATGSFITINSNFIIIKKTTKKNIQIILDEGEEHKEANAND